MGREHIPPRTPDFFPAPPSPGGSISLPIRTLEQGMCSTTLGCAAREIKTLNWTCVSLGSLGRTISRHVLPGLCGQDLVVRRPQGWLLWEAAKSFPHVQQSQLLEAPKWMWLDPPLILLVISSINFSNLSLLCLCWYLVRDLSLSLSQLINPSLYFLSPVQLRRGARKRLWLWRAPLVRAVLITTQWVQSQGGPFT